MPGPKLPFRYVVHQDLYSTDPTQETCVADHAAGDTAPVRQPELAHADQELLFFGFPLGVLFRGLFVGQ